MIISYFHYFELLSFIFSIVFYQNLKEKKIEAFALFLGLTVVTELLASNWLPLTGIYRNDVIYNIYWLISFPIQLYIYYRVLNLSPNSKKAFIAFSTVLTIASLVNFFFFQGIFIFNTYSFIFFQLVIIFFSVLILFQIVTEEDDDINFLSSPYFWIFGSGLLFSLGSLIIIGLRQFILVYNLTINGKHIYQVLMPILIVILYSSYSYGFYLCKKQMKKL